MSFDCYIAVHGESPRVTSLIALLSGHLTSGGQARGKAEAEPRFPEKQKE
jgi:hypothetical protein